MCLSRNFKPVMTSRSFTLGFLRTRHGASLGPRFEVQISKLQPSAHHPYRCRWIKYCSIASPLTVALPSSINNFSLCRLRFTRFHSTIPPALQRRTLGLDMKYSSFLNNNAGYTNINIVVEASQYLLHISFRHRQQMVELNTRTAEGVWGTKQRAPLTAFFNTERRTVSLSVFDHHGYYKLHFDSGETLEFTQRLPGCGTSIRYGGLPNLSSQIPSQPNILAHVIDLGKRYHVFVSNITADFLQQLG